MPLDSEIFACFASPIDKRGKRQLIGVAEAERLKQAAVLRGFATRAGRPRKNLSCLEHLVIVMRDATSGEDFNHEWWAAEVSKPTWVHRLDTVFRRGWLYFPAEKQELTARNLGDRIGFELAFTERKLGRLLRESTYRNRTEAAELEKARRGLQPSDRKKVRVAIPGYDNLRQLASERYANIQGIRQTIMAVAGGLRERASDEFIQGLAGGTQRAHEVDMEDALSQFNEREEVATILSEGWSQITQMRTRREITDYVIAHLPDKQRSFLEENRAQRLRFVERMRQTFYEQIDLRPAARGRPVKSVRR